jgi:hypothetical protein
MLEWFSQVTEQFKEHTGFITLVAVFLARGYIRQTLVAILVKPWFPEEAQKEVVESGKEPRTLTIGPDVDKSQRTTAPAITSQLTKEAVALALHKASKSYTPGWIYNGQLKVHASSGNVASILEYVSEQTGKQYLAFSGEIGTETFLFNCLDEENKSHSQYPIGPKRCYLKDLGQQLMFVNGRPLVVYRVGYPSTQFMWYELLLPKGEIRQSAVHLNPEQLRSWVEAELAELQDAA